MYYRINVESTGSLGNCIMTAICELRNAIPDIGESIIPTCISFQLWRWLIRSPVERGRFAVLLLLFVGYRKHKHPDTVFGREQGDGG